MVSIMMQFNTLWSWTEMIPMTGPVTVTKPLAQQAHANILALVTYERWSTGCKMLKYLSKVNNHIVIKDIAASINAVACKVAAIAQLETSCSSIAAWAIVAGTDTTPTVKSTTDWIRIRK